MDRQELETAATAAPVHRDATAATERPLTGSEPTLAAGSVVPVVGAVVAASRVRRVFLGVAALGAANVCYFVWRFLVAAHPPVLHHVFQTIARGREASVGFLDGPRITLASYTLIALVFLAVAAWVARQHRGDAVVQLMATLAVLGGQLSVSVTQLTSMDDVLAARVVSAAIYTLVPLGALTVMAVFPSGRPVPRWSIFIAPLGAVTYALQARHMFLVRDYSLVFSAAALPCFVTLLACQWYRFRRHASLLERNQIKWLCYAAVAYGGIQAAAIGGVLPLLYDTTRPAFPLLKLVYSVMIASSYLVGLACAMFSAARYRLWDIDRLINRTVVYGVVTLVLGAAFVVAFFVGRLGLRAIDAPDEVAIAISLGVAVAAFPWTRRRIARWIDRRFYGIGLDYEVLAAKAVRAEALTQAQLGGYDGLALLGRGGMGAVYRAHHEGFGVPVALKVIAPVLAGDADAQARFRREAQILDGLRHPHVVPFLASGHEQGLAYIAMQLVDGPDLGKLVAARGRLPLAEVRMIIAAIAEALDVAHARGVVHRDVKPANILLEQGDASRAMLMDFGVARLAGDRPLRGDDQLVGSLPYIAPEQIQEADRVDGRADIYSLGATAYELLTGRPPFREPTPLALVMAHLRQPPPDPRTFDHAIPDAVAKALLRALAKAPGDRFATAGELAAALSPS